MYTFYSEIFVKVNWFQCIGTKKQNYSIHSINFDFKSQIYITSMYLKFKTKKKKSLSIKLTGSSNK